MAVTEKFKRSQSCIVIDIGAQLCDIIVYIKGYIVYSAVLPMGGDDATQELANIINNSPSEAEEIKLKYGCVFLQMVDEDEKIKISNKQEESHSKRMTLAIVLADKYREIFNNIRNEISEKKIIDFGISGNISVVLTGGGSLISGAAKLATEVFGHTAELQNPAVNTELDMNDLIDSPVYSTVIGLILFAKKRDVFKDSPESIQVNPVDNKSVGLFQGLLNILKKIFFG
jgi:cell division protein FtsA